MFHVRTIGNLAAGAYFALATVFILMTARPAEAAAPEPIVSQSPISVGGNAPGNLLLVPSVEFPTIDSVANLGDYATGSLYVGYFDSGKCYRYHYEATEANRHFYPVGTTTDHTCSGGNEWSGNYLNWAATQTIDPFRKALTGGLRVVDTETTTILEKARSDNQSSATYFPNRVVTSNTAILNATPTNGWGDFYTRISRLGNKMHFSRTNNVGGETSGAAAAIPYTGGALASGDNNIYEVSIRVKVCDPSVGLENNCVRYGSNYKPEGLIQKYASRMRYSAFGYLNDHSMTRDGGVLRARQKFVGPYIPTFTTDNGWVNVANPNREWDPATGILERNPDPDDAQATTNVINNASYVIRDSGVINYINKFGQMTPQSHKNYDPVSELYYTAIRYLKNLGNVPAYTNLNSGSAATNFNYADGFPVITNWNDPIQYRCQNNAILGIGDVYTHRDKNLPGSGTSSSDEPTKPTQVSNDTTVNVRTATEKVAALQGLSINTGANSWSGRENSAFIAGLAYDSHTKDLRPDNTNPTLPGKQTVSTYWVDVRENQRLEPPSANQYWLATKFGGFDVPDDFDPYAATTTALPANSWQHPSDTLTHAGGATYPRPKNFYVASQANEMVTSLTRAFARIVAEEAGSSASLAANSTRLDTETRTFQAQFRSRVWSGELHSFAVDTTTGALSANPVWSAGALLDARAWNSRTIKAANDTGTGLVNFTTAADGLSSTQKSKLGGTDATLYVNYLRGERVNEESESGTGTLRTRASILGDIVNSTPLFIGAPNAALHAGRPYAGGSTYGAWAADNARRNRTPIVYVGANDGMLHAFNANTGAEVFAFVPNTVINNGLLNYTDPLYEHRFFVDGETAAAEIYDTAINNWRTVLVGSLGRGGPGIFALDVTNPASPELMWEFDGTDIPELGRNIGRPVIAQVASGDWRVFLGNGPDSGEGAQMISIRIGSSSNGAVTTFGPGSASTANGMTALLVRDSDLDTYADTAYAGDLEGSVWKISDIGGTPSALRLFSAVDASNNAQPITAAPMVGRDPQTGFVWVFVGTGRYLNENDIGDESVQTWYGLIDQGSTIGGRANLVQREIVAEPTVSGVLTRVIEPAASGDMAGKRGWYIDLVSPGVDGARGERMVVQNRFQGEALIGTTRIPGYSDACDPGGTGFVMAISPFTGARLATTFFDVDGDGTADQGDMYCEADVCVPVSGIGFNSSPNNPIFIENVMQVGLDSGETRTIETFGSAVEARRLSWRELFNE